METHPPSSTIHPRRLLVRGVNWLGDAVMTTPALMRLRERFPDTHITMLTPEKLHGLWLNHPAVNEVIAFEEGESVFAVGKKLRSGRFDMALVLPNSPRSGIEMFLAGIPKRVGYARPWRNFFLTDVIAPRAGAVKMQKRSEVEIKKLISQPSSPKPQIRSAAHQSNEYLHLAAALGANADPLSTLLTVTPQEVDAAKTKFGLQNAGTIFGLNAGAEYGPAKRWPADRFIAAAKEIQKRTDCAWILFGGRGDLEMTNPIETALRDSGQVFNFAGKTSLRELMALMKLCGAVLTNDSGPMHVAAALGMPVVAIFGSTSPELTGPISEKARIVRSDAHCSPCFLRECPIDFRCMKGIEVEKVVELVVAQASRL